MLNTNGHPVSLQRSALRSLPTSSFQPIPSQLPLGQPIADIAKGWDGTLWAVDTQGTPHLYDSLQQVWQPFGDSIDAACWYQQPKGKKIWLFCKGDELFQANGVQTAPQKIRDVFAKLPPSFQMGVSGAANVGGTTYLFKSGLFVPVRDGVAQPPQALNTLAAWPQTPAWREGVFDLVGSGDGSDSRVVFLRGGEVLIADFAVGKVTWGPFPLNQGYGPTLVNLLNTGQTNALLYDGSVGDGKRPVHLFMGPALWSFGAGTQDANPVPGSIRNVIDQWPWTWHPALAHAPNGRVGNLWAAMGNSKGVMYHDGRGWNALEGTATYASVGSDNNVYTIGDGSAVYQWQGDGSWNQLAPPPSGAILVQLSVGDANHIWARDNQNTVYAQADGAFTPSAQVGQAVHLAANYDGSVWHCNNDATAYRFAGGATPASDPLAVPQGTVQKVASTGFGTGHCLTNANGQQLYEYTSSFVFKSAPGYQLPSGAAGQIVEGLGRLFFIYEEGYTNRDYNPNFQDYVVALDSQTGQQLWKTPVAWKNGRSTAPVFDSRLKLIYIGLAVANTSDTTNPGAIMALDAQTGAVVWSGTKRAANYPGDFVSVDCAPALAGNLLYFGDRAGYLHALDTDASLANKNTVTKWSMPGTTGTGYSVVSTPVIVNNVCYFYTYSPGDSSFYVQRCAASDGSGMTLWRTLTVPSPEATVMWPPVFGRANFAVGRDALFIQACNEVHAVNLSVVSSGPLNGLDADYGFTLGGSVTFTTGLSYCDGTLWLGDSRGCLHGLNGNTGFTHVNGTPHQITEPGLNLALLSVVAYQDAQGNTAVFCAGTALHLDSPNNTLFAYDPANAVVETISTGKTLIWGLGAVNSNGMLPAAGFGSQNSSLGPVFSIRADQVISTLRDFIIESQLMQDYDDAPAGQTPPTVARYQTHVTIVDNLKAPRPFETVKIWADKAGTVISVNGRNFTVGPDDASHAAVQTGADGSFVIVSDATDLSAPTLRLWAGFMDPFERVTVCRDQEFHRRIMTAHADSSDTDPNKVNLITAHKYTAWKSVNGHAEPVNRTPLCNDKQAPQVASAIQQLGHATGMGTPAVATLGLHRFGADNRKYAAYSDLPGQGYSPVNVPLQRIAKAVSPAGLTFTTAAGFAASSPAEATLAIDSLDGNAWVPPMQAALGSHLLGGFWDDLWNAVKDAVKTIATAVTHVIVSVAEDIYVGIRIFVNGVATVFRAIVHTLEDAVKAIGSFFLKIGKLIEDAIEALSIFWHLDEIVKTHVAIRNEIQRRASLFANSITNNAIPQLNRFFEQGETAISNLFDTLKSKLTGTPPITSLKGMGSTSHSLYTVKPKNGPSAGSSHAVQCSWASNKMSGNYGATRAGVSAIRATPQPIEDFLNTFTKRITNDGDLQSTFEGVKTDFHNLFHPSSAGDFMKQAVNALLDTLKLLLQGALAVSNAFLDGLLTVFSDVLNLLFDPTSGILNESIDIPVLSSLYQMAFGEPLTLLNLITLVAAIPVTIVYQVVEGHYPSVDLATEAALGASSTLTMLMTLFGGIISVVSGMLSAISDSFGKENSPTILSILELALGVLSSAVAYPFSSPGTLDWAAWGAGLGAAALNIFSVLKLGEDLQEVMTYLEPVFLMLLSIALLSIFIDQLVNSHASTLDVAALALSIASTIPGIMNPLKLATELLAVVVAVADGIVGFAVGAIQFLMALSSAEGSQQRAIPVAALA